MVAIVRLKVLISLSNRSDLIIVTQRPGLHTCKISNFSKRVCHSLTWITQSYTFRLRQCQGTIGGSFYYDIESACVRVI